MENERERKVIRKAGKKGILNNIVFYAVPDENTGGYHVMKHEEPTPLGRFFIRIYALFMFGTWKVEFKPPYENVREAGQIDDI